MEKNNTSYDDLPENLVDAPSRDVILLSLRQAVKKKSDEDCRTRMRSFHKHCLLSIVLFICNVVAWFFNRYVAFFLTIMSLASAGTLLGEYLAIRKISTKSSQIDF